MATERRATNDNGQDPDALYWSEAGEICCGEHAPRRGSDTWRRDGWRRVKPDELPELRREGMCGCEECGRAPSPPPPPRAAARSPRAVIHLPGDRTYEGGGRPPLRQLRLASGGSIEDVVSRSERATVPVPGGAP